MPEAHSAPRCVHSHVLGHLGLQLCQHFLGGFEYTFLCPCLLPYSAVQLRAIPKGVTRNGLAGLNTGTPVSASIYGFHPHKAACTAHKVNGAHIPPLNMLFHNGAHFLYHRAHTASTSFWWAGSFFNVSASSKEMLWLPANTKVRCVPPVASSATYTTCPFSSTERPVVPPPISPNYTVFHPARRIGRCGFIQHSHHFKSCPFHHVAVGGAVFYGCAGGHSNGSPEQGAARRCSSSSFQFAHNAGGTNVVHHQAIVTTRANSMAQATGSLAALSTTSTM